jgi:hypothetical protein
MKISAGINPLAERFVDDREYQTPVPVRALLTRINNGSIRGLEAAIAEAFAKNGTPLSHDANPHVDFYQVGRFAYIFKVQPHLPGERTTAPNLIMQIARGDENSFPGRVVARDAANLAWLQEHVGTAYFPALISAGNPVAISSHQSFPTIFTEFLEGYHELALDDSYGITGSLIANRLAGEGKAFETDEGKELMREMMKIVGYAFAATYDPTTGKGQLVHDMNLAAGDFVYRSTEDERPLVKLITVRRLSEATPNELLISLLSPYDLSPTFHGTYRPHYFCVKGDKDPTRTMLEGLEMGLQEVYGSEAPRTLAQWKERFSQTIEGDIGTILAGVRRREITSIEHVPAGFRSLISYHAVSAYLVEQVRRGGQREMINPTPEHYEPAFQRLATMDTGPIAAEVSARISLITQH